MKYVKIAVDTVTDAKQTFTQNLEKVRDLERKKQNVNVCTDKFVGLLVKEATRIILAIFAYKILHYFIKSKTLKHQQGNRSRDAAVHR